MAKFRKAEVLAAMERWPVVPVFYHGDAATVEGVAQACYRGGVRVFEFTNRGEGAHAVFERLVRFVRAECPEMVLGAGTVVDAPTAALYMQLGADFVVSPLLNPEVARVCNRRMVPYVPGCLTPSEMGAAQEAGCDVCKIFPAGDPSFVKNILAPMPWSRIMATGGISPANVGEWMAAGTMCVGMGSCLFPKEAVERGDWNRISEICAEALEKSKQ
jgi:2-dehydro-3-deoxyphosphogluconate aldolase/(4S)-4-hydroxy-2-oxoglutarate aldolase